MSFAARASDDVGVAGVVVNFVQANGVAGQMPMTFNPAGGLWIASWTVPGGLKTYEVVATDFANHTGHAAGAC